MKIRIFDDEAHLRKDLKKKVKSLDLSSGDTEFDIDVINTEQFQKSLNGMKKRQGCFREEGVWDHDGSNALDDVSILIIDYDLFDAQAFLDAERIAYLARSFTTCGIIVVLNRFGHNPFDLTLKDSPESFADLDIGQEQLNNPYLWGVGKDEFAPWYWPSLPDLVKDYEERIKDVTQAIEKGQSIWNTLGFTGETRDRIPEELDRFLGSESYDLRFDRFVVESDYGLARKDRVKVFNDDDTVKDPDTIARIAAARIGKWLEFQVLPEMDILIDAPHLAARLPSLVDSDDIEDWSAIAVRYSRVIPKLRTDLIEEFRMKKPYWLSRPVWFWREILENADIEDVREPWKVKPPDWVFCEDTSSFYSEEECTEFWADTVSPFANRFIRRFEDVQYMPLARLAR